MKPGILNHGLILAGLLTIGISPAWALPTYRIVSLGDAVPAGLNDQGYVVGNNLAGDTAVLFEPGGLMSATVWSSSNARGINDSGQVAGRILQQGEWLPAWSADWSGGFQALPTLGGTTGRAQRINDDGWIVGTSRTSSGDEHAFLYKAGSLIDLGTLTAGAGYDSTGMDINAQGQVVGHSERFTSTGVVYQPFVHDEINGMRHISLCTGGGPQCSHTVYGMDINDAGVVVGNEIVSGFGKSFTYDLGTQSWSYLPSMVGRDWVRAINNAGAAVGFDLTAQSQQYAALWQEGQVYVLDSLLENGQGWVLTDAYDINASGQIIGIGQYNGTQQGYLISPVSEAGTWAMLLAGLGLIGLRLNPSPSGPMRRIV